MKNLLTTTAVALTLAAFAAATDIDLSVESGGTNLVQALAGTTVDYQVFVELSDAENEGLALLCFDLTFDGGPLDPATAPDSSTIDNFRFPLGMSNPAGFGGTPSSGVLLQVGGAQNTIKNTFAPQPTGTVITDVAQPGAPLLFVTGSVAVPDTAGTYQLTVDEVIANVIGLGETGLGEFWAVDRAEAGLVTPLTIQVTECGPFAYCDGKANSLGCVPSIGWTGAPTASGADDFHVTASQVLNQQFGMVFLGPQPSDVPFMGGTRCVSHPLTRTGILFSGGSATGSDCTGALDYHFTQARMTSLGFNVGDAVYAQGWYRDPLHTDGTGMGLSNAAAFLICP